MIGLGPQIGCWLACCTLALVFAEASICEELAPVRLRACPAPTHTHTLLCCRRRHRRRRLQGPLLLLAMELMAGGSLQAALRRPDARQQLRWGARCAQIPAAGRGGLPSGWEPTALLAEPLLQLVSAGR